jgi:hypothetical protein
MTKTKFHLATCVRNEGPYLLDWVLYHRALGFDEITVYSNDNTDGSDHLLHELQQKGLITWVNRQLKEGESPQLTAYPVHSQKLFESASKSDSLAYLAWLDVDEYLILKHQNNLSDLLTRYQNPDALVINWRHFGSAGKTHWENISTPLRFCYRADSTSLDKHFKSISRLDPDIFKVINNHRPILKRGSSARIIYASSSDSDVPLAQEFIDGMSPVSVSDAPVFHDVCYLAHYAVRSREEFLWKKSRGNGRLPLDAAKAHFLDGYFPSHDLNDVYDTFAAERFVEVLGRLSSPDYASLTALFGPWADQTVKAATC